MGIRAVVISRRQTSTVLSPPQSSTSTISWPPGHVELLDVTHDRVIVLAALYIGTTKERASFIRRVNR